MESLLSRLSIVQDPRFTTQLTNRDCRVNLRGLSYGSILYSKPKYDQNYFVSTVSTNKKERINLKSTPVCPYKLPQLAGIIPKQVT